MLYLSELGIVGHNEDLSQAVGVVVPPTVSNVHDDDFLFVGGAKHISCVKRKGVMRMS